MMSFHPLRVVLGSSIALALTALTVSVFSIGPAGQPALAEAAQRGGCSHTKAVPGRAAPRKLRRAVVCLIKKRRQAHNAGRASANAKLARASVKHSRKMTRSRCFSHQCGGEDPLGERIRRTGYMRNARAWSYGEVIGWGLGKRGTPRVMVDAWMHSSSHRAILLNGHFHHLGVGIKAEGPFGQNRGATYTVDFGYRNR